MKQAFTFDDVLLVPQYSDIKRGDISFEQILFGYKAKMPNIPIISSPMDTITEIEMIRAMDNCGGYGVHHRYCHLDKLWNVISQDNIVPCIAVSPSISMEFLQEVFDCDPDVILFLDVAHGHTKKNLLFVDHLRSLGFNNIVSGNIATKEAARAYFISGVRAFRVGLGGGSSCITRQVTGVGVPQLSAVNNIYGYFKEMGVDDITIISDGGHRNTGDIVKSLRFGADYVMLGGMLAGHKECPIPLEFRGMASKPAQESRGKENYVVEGESFVTPTHGLTSVTETLKRIESELRLSFYYLGASNIEELRECDFNFVTPATVKENSAHYGK